MRELHGQNIFLTDGKQFAGILKGLENDVIYKNSKLNSYIHPKFGDF